MDANRGVWIDHRHAIIVTLTHESTLVEEIESQVAKRARAAGGSRSSTLYGPQDVMAEDRRDRNILLQLAKFYDRVASALAHSQAIAIFGPGEAKHELNRHLAKDRDLAGRVVSVETTDKLTPRQIVAKVKQDLGG